MSDRPGFSSLRYLAMVLVAFAGSVPQLASASPAKTEAALPSDARLEKAYRFQQGGWTYVHLEGSPADIGFQHGYLLAPEIADALEAIKLFDTRQTQRDWEFFRQTARCCGRTSTPSISRNCGALLTA
ncbi:MAG: hypothetical protein WB799_17720 [Candidatus Sulfotelmatobacter sp.]